MSNFFRSRYARSSVQLILAVAMLLSVSGVTQPPPAQPGVVKPQPPVVAPKKDHDPAAKRAAAQPGAPDGDDDDNEEKKPSKPQGETCLVDYSKDLRYFPEPALEKLLTAIQEAQNAKETKLAETMAAESDYSARFTLWRDSAKTNDAALLDLAMLAFHSGNLVPKGFRANQWGPTKAALFRELGSRTSAAADGSLLKGLPTKLNRTPAEADLEWMFSHESTTATLFDKWLAKLKMPTSKEAGLGAWKKWAAANAKLEDLKLGDLSYAELSILKEHLLNQFDEESTYALKAAFNAKFPNEFKEPAMLEGENRAKRRALERRIACQTANPAADKLRQLNSFISKTEGDRDVARHGLPLEYRAGYLRQTIGSVGNIKMEMELLNELAAKGGEGNPDKKLLLGLKNRNGFFVQDILDLAYHAGVADLTGYVADNRLQFEIDKNDELKKAGKPIDEARQKTLEARKAELVAKGKERRHMAGLKSEDSVMKMSHIARQLGRPFTEAELKTIRAMPSEEFNDLSDLLHAIGEVDPNSTYFGMLAGDVKRLFNKETRGNGDIFKALKFLDGRNHFDLDPKGLTKLVFLPRPRGMSPGASAWVEEKNAQILQHFLDLMPDAGAVKAKYPTRASLFEAFDGPYANFAGETLAKRFCGKDKCDDGQQKSPPTDAEILSIYRFLKVAALSLEHGKKITLPPVTPGTGEQAALQERVRRLFEESQLLKEEFKSLDEHQGPCTVGATNCRTAEVSGEKLNLWKRLYADHEREKKAWLDKAALLEASDKPEDTKRAAAYRELANQHVQIQQQLSKEIFSHMTPRVRAEAGIGDGDNDLADLTWVCANPTENYSLTNVPERLLYSPNDYKKFLIERFMDELLAKIEPDKAKRVRMMRGEFSDPKKDNGEDEVKELKKRLQDVGAYDAAYSDELYYYRKLPNSCSPGAAEKLRNGVAWLHLLKNKANSVDAGTRTNRLTPSLARAEAMLVSRFSPSASANRVEIKLKTKDPLLRAEVDRLMAVDPGKVATAEAPRLAALSTGNPAERKLFSELLSYFKDFPEEHAVRKAVYAHTMPSGWPPATKEALNKDKGFLNLWAKAPADFLIAEHARVSMGLHDVNEKPEALKARVQLAVDDDERKIAGMPTRKVGEAEKKAENVEVKSTLAAHKALVEDTIANFFKPVIDQEDDKEAARLLENPKVALEKVLAYVKSLGHNEAEAMFALGQARAYFTWNLLMLQSQLRGKPIAGAKGLDGRLSALLVGKDGKKQQRLLKALTAAIHSIDHFRENANPVHANNPPIPVSPNELLDFEMQTLEKAFANASADKKHEFQQYVNELSVARRNLQHMDRRVGQNGRVRNTEQLNSDVQLLGLENCEMFLRLHGGKREDGNEYRFAGLTAQSKVALSGLPPVMAVFAKEMCAYDWLEANDEAQRSGGSSKNFYKWTTNGKANDALIDFIHAPYPGRLYYLMVHNDSIRAMMQSKLTDLFFNRQYHLRNAIAARRIGNRDVSGLEKEMEVLEVLGGYRGGVPPWSDLQIPLGIKGLMEFLPKMSGADREKLRDWAATQLINLVGPAEIAANKDEAKMRAAAAARVRAGGGNPLYADSVDDNKDFTKHMLVMMLNLIDESGDSETGPAAQAAELAKGGVLRFDPIYAAVRLSQERELKPKAKTEMFATIPVSNQFKSLGVGLDFHGSRLRNINGNQDSPDARLLYRLNTLSADGKEYTPEVLAATDWDKMDPKVREKIVNELMNNYNAAYEAGVADVKQTGRKGAGGFHPETERLARDYRKALSDLMAQHEIKVRAEKEKVKTAGEYYQEKVQPGQPRYHTTMEGKIDTSYGLVYPPPTADVPKRVMAVHSVLVGENGEGGIFDILERRTYRSMSKDKRAEMAETLKSILKILEKDKAVAHELEVGSRSGRPVGNLAAVLPDMIRQLEHEDEWPSPGEGTMARTKAIFGLDTYWIPDVLTSTAGKNWADMTDGEKRELREKLASELESFDSDTVFHTDMVGFVERDRKETRKLLVDLAGQRDKLASENPKAIALKARYDLASVREDFYTNYYKHLKPGEKPVVSDMRRLHSAMIDYIDWERKNPKATDDQKKAKRKELDEAQGRMVFFLEKIKPPSQLPDATKPVEAVAENRKPGELPLALTELERLDPWPERSKKTWESTKKVLSLDDVGNISGIVDLIGRPTLDRLAGKPWGEMTAADKAALAERVSMNLMVFKKDVNFQTDLTERILKAQKDNDESVRAIQREFDKLSKFDARYKEVEAQLESVKNMSQKFYRMIETTTKGGKVGVTDVQEAQENLVAFLKWEAANPKATKEEFDKQLKGVSDSYFRSRMILTLMANTAIEAPKEEDRAEVAMAVQRWKAKWAVRGHMMTYEAELKFRAAIGGPPVDAEGKVQPLDVAPAPRVAKVQTPAAPKGPPVAPVENQQQLTALLNVLATAEHQGKGLSTDQRLAILQRDADTNRALLAMEKPLVNGLGSHGLQRTKEVWQRLAQTGKEDDVAKARTTLLPNDSAVATADKVDTAKTRAEVRAEILAKGVLSTDSKKKLLLMAEYDVAMKWLPERFKEIFAGANPDDAKKLFDDLHEAQEAVVAERAETMEADLRAEVAAEQSRKYRTELAKKVGAPKSSNIVTTLQSLILRDARDTSKKLTPDQLALLKDPEHAKFIAQLRQIYQIDPAKEYAARVANFVQQKARVESAKPTPDFTVLEDLAKIQSDFLPEFNKRVLELSKTHSPLDAVDRAWAEVSPKFAGNKELSASEFLEPAYNHLADHFVIGMTSPVARMKRNLAQDTKIQPEQWCIERTAASWDGWKKAEAERVKKAQASPAVTDWQKYQAESKKELSALTVKEIQEGNRIKRAVHEIELVEQKIKSLEDLKTSPDWSDSRKMNTDTKERYEAHLKALKADLKLRREHLEQGVREVKKTQGTRQIVEKRLAERKAELMKGLSVQVNGASDAVTRREKYLRDYVAKADKNDFIEMVNAGASRLERYFDRRDKLENLGRALVESSPGGAVPANWKDDARVKRLLSPEANEGCSHLAGLSIIENALNEHSNKIKERSVLLAELAKYGVEFDGNALDFTSFRVDQPDNIKECAINDATKLPVDRDKCQAEMERLGKERYAKFKKLLKDVSPFLPKGTEDPVLAALGESIMGDTAHQFEERLAMTWYKDGMRRMDEFFDPTKLGDPIQGAAVRMMPKGDGTFEVAIFNLAEQREKAAVIAQGSRDAIKKHGMNLKLLRQELNHTLQFLYNTKPYYNRVQENLVAIQDRTEALDDFGGVSVQLKDSDPKGPAKEEKSAPLPSHLVAQHMELEYAHEIVTDIGETMAKIDHDETMRAVAIGVTIAVVGLYMVSGPLGPIAATVLHGAIMGGGLHLVGSIMDTDLLPAIGHAANGTNPGSVIDDEKASKALLASSQQYWGGLEGRGVGTLTGMATFAIGNGAGALIGRGLAAGRYGTSLLADAAPAVGVTGRTGNALVRLGGNETMRQVGVMFGTSWAMNMGHAYAKAEHGGFKLTWMDNLIDPTLHAAQTAFYMLAPDQRVAGFFDRYIARMAISVGVNQTMSLGMGTLDYQKQLWLLRGERDTLLKLGKKDEAAEMTKQIDEMATVDAWARQMGRAALTEIPTHLYFAKMAADHGWRMSVQKNLAAIAKDPKPGALEALRARIRRVEGKNADPDVILGQMASSMPQATVYNLTLEAARNPGGEAAKTVAVLAHHYKMTPERFIATFREHSSNPATFQPLGSLGAYETVQGSRDGQKAPTATILPKVPTLLGRLLPGRLGTMMAGLGERLKFNRDPGSQSPHSIEPGKSFLALAEQRIEADLTAATTPAQKQAHVEELVNLRPKTWEREEIRDQYPVELLIPELQAGTELSPPRQLLLMAMANHIGLHSSEPVKKLLTHWKAKPGEVMDVKTLREIVAGSHPEDAARQAELIRENRLSVEAITDIWDNPDAAAPGIMQYVMSEPRSAKWDAPAFYRAYRNQTGAPLEFKLFYASYNPPAVTPVAPAPGGGAPGPGGP